MTTSENTVTPTSQAGADPELGQPVQRLPMTGWYDPGQLLQTAVDVFTSTIFGRHADHRFLEALSASSSDETYYDYTCHVKHVHGSWVADPARPRQEVWIDYVADLGDGWDSTYSVAYHLARPRLTLTSSKGGSLNTERGSLLIFGGDEVYPTPSQRQYKQRLVNLYESAFQAAGQDVPHLFAIPGNHDWYDSLVSFTRRFISRERVAGCLTRQTRSYFALKLPSGWWLLGTDMQLGSDIDGPQVQYFKDVAKMMKKGDRVILCNAEPHWIYAKQYQALDPDCTERNLTFLEREVLKKRVTVFLAGDLHHYRRHEATDGAERIQKITAGGGGAFLHPTHGQDVRELVEEHEGSTRVFRLMTSWPDESRSRRLCWRNLLFPVLNWKFGIVPAVLYLLTAWSVMADIGSLGLSQIVSAITTTVAAILNAPFAVFWVLFTLVGFVLFTDTHSTRYRWVAGPLHALAHLLATLFIGWGAAYLTVHEWQWPFRSIPQLLVSGGLIFGSGWLVGSFIMGVYLLISLNLVGRHSNEAFSSLRIADWKHFLRLKIAANGDLTIYPIGIRRIARDWTDGLPCHPQDPKATAPELIEDPIVLKNPSASRAETATHKKNRRS
ncbi:MAG: hypothetical protein ACREIS_09425 [Nitrospiraceae bacterium]